MRGKRIRESHAHFTAVWEFHVEADKRRTFEKVYGANGEWSQLFRRGEGYIRTELFRDPKTPGRYVTLDFWTSRLAYQKFKQQNIAAYKALDRRCESLTARERRIGEFAKVVPQRLIVGRGGPVAGVSVRRATHADLPAIMAIEKQTPSAAHWNVNTYHEIFNDEAPQRIVFVSEFEDGSLKGFVVARFDGHDCELENIVVAKDERRLGIASLLMQHLRTEAQQLDGKNILLEVRESNRGARRLYEKSGFLISGRRKSYYQRPQEDSILYTLKL